jgi:glutamate synthase domain-containing protein 1/glutamate synthase domain-containing protein 3
MISQREIAEKLIKSRKSLAPQSGALLPSHKSEAEGGCGVIGIACSEQIPARHLLQALEQMRNRGNGKGGGMAAVGLVPEEVGVSQEILERDYLLTIAYLDPTVRPEVERDHIEPTFEVDHVHHASAVDDFRTIRGLEVQPPEVYLYFGQVKPDVIEEFKRRNGLGAGRERGQAPLLQRVEDEVVYQNSYRLNQTFYASTGETRAFVLSHGKNMLVLKMVGYGDDVIRYYQLEDMHAHVWIGHHRYPTKGKVWHPGGAHPFVGLHEALVHNGDFANYASICEYLAQRNIYPLFLTDTEVSVLVFDLLGRIYGYPLEYVIESLAPTTERDFTLLPEDKQHIYRLLQTVHMHGSPDGPWFFLIAQSAQPGSAYRLIGITDTSMLRPQVFALQQGPASIGFAASEKQAIDAALESLASEDPRFWTRADLYWNARGGSHTDGGAFTFTVRPDGEHTSFVCMDKFGRRITVNGEEQPYGGLGQSDGGSSGQPDGDHTSFGIDDVSRRIIADGEKQAYADSGGDDGHKYPSLYPQGPGLSAEGLFNQVVKQLAAWDYGDVTSFLSELERSAQEDASRERAIEVLTLLMDRRYPTGKLRRSRLLSLFDKSLAAIVELIRQSPSEGYVFVSAAGPRPSPASEVQTVVMDARGFAPEGDHSLAIQIVRLHQRGFRRFLVAHTRGQRFIANGLGPKSEGVRINVYGSSGDYLASGIDGAEVFVHSSAQDQLAQIMKDGKLVVYGDVGQTFMYAAKGGKAFILGNAAGRPLINAVGKPRVVINGTCLDYLAESFMAGDPLNGGGFVILNGITYDNDGQIVELETPYPGGNLFSLASGGAIYIRDPYGKVSTAQLNGGEFAQLEERDWVLIKPYLEENERLFGIPLARLLEVDGRTLPPQQVYRKIQPRAIQALQAEEAWVKMRA